MYGAVEFGVRVVVKGVMMVLTVVDVDRDGGKVERILIRMKVR